MNNALLVGISLHAAAAFLPTVPAEHTRLCILVRLADRAQLILTATPVCRTHTHTRTTRLGPRGPAPLFSIGNIGGTGGNAPAHHNENTCFGHTKLNEKLFIQGLRATLFIRPDPCRQLEQPAGAAQTPATSHRPLCTLGHAPAAAVGAGRATPWARGWGCSPAPAAAALLRPGAASQERWGVQRPQSQGVVCYK